MRHARSKRLPRRPEWTTGRLGNLFERACRIGAGDHERVSCSRTLSCRTLSLGMSQTVHGRRSNEDRHRHWPTQHAGAGIALVNIDQYTRAQTDAGEIRLISPQGDLIVATACVKIPEDWIHPFLRQYFILRNIDWLHTSFFSPSFFRCLTDKE